MIFLADESVDMAVVRSLRSDGFDVRSVSEDLPGIPDEEVAALAREDDRVLLTEDRDFGRIFYAQWQESAGVIYMRYPMRARHEFANDVVSFVRTQMDKIPGSFIVLQPGRSRISRLPPV